MVENATMIPEGVFLEERKVRFLVRQCGIFWRFWQKMSRANLLPSAKDVA
jgi:hypothetical protein